MKKRDLILTWIVVFVVLIVLSFLLDKEISVFLESIRNFVLNDIFLGITFISSEIIIFFFLTSLFLWKERKRAWILPLWLSLLFTALVSFVLKVIIQRQRPFELGIVSTLPLLNQVSNAWNYSMPSFQAMMVFSALPVLNKEFPRFKYFWILFAMLVAVSRVYLGLHFASDVVVGSMVGLLIGLLIVQIQEKTNFGEKIYKKVFRRK
jgi:membrane-associated phospholipid phosphatase